MTVSILCKKIRSNAVIPIYASKGAAGADLYACLESPLTIPPYSRSLIPTGLILEIPMGYEGQVRPRSGNALHKGITVLNAPGTIDCDYRGEIKVILYNSSDKSVIIEQGDRIAQLIIAPVLQASFIETDCLSETERHIGGFGSTGT